MNFKSVILGIITLIFSSILLVSCENKKTEKKETETEVVTAHTYQCPMDCEEGKTYEKEGSCPVCKMDLKAIDGAESMTCKKHKDGKCSCKKKKCACKDCEEHSKKMSCKKDKDGKCSCKEKCTCKDCQEQGKKMTCKKDEDGKCSCKEKCACTNCAEHS